MCLEASPPMYVSSDVFEYIKIISKLKPSLEELPLELKHFPSHLCYAFLGQGEIFPVIISSNLKQEQEAKLLSILRQFKKDIPWLIENIK